MSHLGPHGGNLHSCTNNGAVNSGQQDAGLHNTCLHPGPSAHPRHLAARPLFYVHAPSPPPPPPFLHYQWSLPMPLFYNPLEGFPGMGYGIVTPPFPSYMETPAYIIPHTQIQPVDYRRLLQPQTHVSAVPYQNPSQTRRIHPPHGVSTETVNSEVQTEPTQRSGDDYGHRSPLVCSDSGRGTDSVSPSSSSSSQKMFSAEANDSESLSQHRRTMAGSDVRDLQVNTDTNGTIKHGFTILHPTITKTVQSYIRETLEEQTDHKDCVEQANVLPSRYSHCNVWSVSSSDSIVPVCSSSQQDDFVKEGCSPRSQIQVSLGYGTPQATVLNMAEMLHQHDQPLPSETQLEHEKSLNRSPANAARLLVSKDGECLYKIIKLPLDQSKEDANETYEMSSNNFQMRKKLNESVWSIESLPPFIPTKEWLLQNGMFEPEVIVELLEEVENRRLSTHDAVVNGGKENETCRFSLCDSVGTKSSCSPDKEATLLNSPAVEPILPASLLIVQNCVDVETEARRCSQPCVPMADVKTTEVSPSKGHLVDCGVQCSNCLCEELRRSMGPNRRRPFRPSDLKTSDGGTEGFYFNGHVQKNQKRPGQWRNRSSGETGLSPESSSARQVSYDGPAAKPGKRGGRNHR